MNLSEKAKSLAKFLSKIEDRLLNLNSGDTEDRYQLFSVAMNRCSRFESQLGTTGVSLLKIMEKNRLSTGEELYRDLYSELPANVDGKNTLSPEISYVARQIARIKSANEIYSETQSGNVKPATDQQLKTGLDRLIKACYVVAAKALIR